jgi:hypothetical protein
MSAVERLERSGSGGGYCARFSDRGEGAKESTRAAVPFPASLPLI